MKKKHKRVHDSTTLADDNDGNGTTYRVDIWDAKVLRYKPGQAYGVKADACIQGNNTAYHDGRATGLRVRVVEVVERTIAAY
jgi:hypothetical protein